MTPQELKHRRLHLGWSRDQLATSLGVPSESVRNWENAEEPIRCPAALEQVLRQEESRSGSSHPGHRAA